MAMKKVEEKNNKKVTTKKKEKVVEAVVEEEKVVCEECGKKYLASLKECPKCGFSPVLAAKKRKTFYDDDDFVEFDDEDGIVKNKEVKDDKKEKAKKIEVKEEKQEKKKKEKKDEISKPKENVNKKVSIKNKRINSSSESNEILSFIKILVVIVLLVGIVWLVVSILNNEFDDKDEKEDEEEVVETIQNDKILATSIFTKVDKAYYVFAYDASEDNDRAVYYATLFGEYDVIEDEDKLPMFWVDLNDPLNKDVVAESAADENTKPSSYGDLSIHSPALIRIKNGKLDKYYDDDYAIDKLKRLIDSFRKEEK